MAEEQERKWWEDEDQPEQPRPSEEELAKKIEQIDFTRKPSKGLWLSQIGSIIYIIINCAALYATINTKYSGFIATYLGILTILLMYNLVVVKRLKKLGG